MNAQEVFAAIDSKPLEIVRVEQPRLGQTWGVREMDASEYSRFTEEYSARCDAHEGEAWFTVWTACDPDTGARLFTPDDLPRLMKLPGSTLRAVWIAGSELNGFSSKATEDREKN